MNDTNEEEGEEKRKKEEQEKTNQPLQGSEKERRGSGGELKRRSGWGRGRGE